MTDEELLQSFEPDTIFVIYAHPRIGICRNTTNK